jgi:hypothetical protein
METISFECANCRQVLKVGAEKAGLKSKCPRCGTPLQIPTVEGGHSSPPKQSPGSPPAKRPTTGEEVVQARWVPDKPPVREEPRRRSRHEEEDDYEEDRGRVRPGKSSKARYDDDEDEDDHPRGRKRSRDDDYDDEDDDRPRARKRSRDDADDDEDDDRPRRRPRARAEEEDDEDDRPRRRRSHDEEDEEDDYQDRKKKKRRGKKRARGLGMMKVASLIGFIAACIIAGACVPQAVLYVMLTIGMAGGTVGNGIFVFLKITEILVLVFGVAALVGYSFNLAVPNRKGSIGFAIATLVVAAAWVVLYFIFQFLPIFGATGGWSGLVGGPGGGPGGGRESLFGGWFLLLLVQMLFSAQFILALFFLRAIALSVKERGLAGQCLSTVFLAAGYAGERIITFIVLYVAIVSVKSESGAKTMGWINMILVWIGFFIFVAMIIPYIQLFFRGQALEED